jgi:hypothetical protein
VCSAKFRYLLSYLMLQPKGFGLFSFHVVSVSVDNKSNLEYVFYNFPSSPFFYFLFTVCQDRKAVCRF